MIKKLTKHGNSLALVLDKGVLDLLEIDVDTPLDLSTDGDLIIISPLRDIERRKKIEKTLKKINQKYSRTLKKLAK